MTSPCPVNTTPNEPCIPSCPANFGLFGICYPYCENNSSTN